MGTLARLTREGLTILSALGAFPHPLPHPCFSRRPAPIASTRPCISGYLKRLNWRRKRHDDFIPGEPVMMQVNDYNRGIFNGDQGLVLNVSERDRSLPMVVFPRSDGFAAFHVDSLRPVLRHSYAMTVHKAQGSEFDNVALILPDRDLPIKTRGDSLHGLDPQPESVVIIGDREILEAGIRRTISRDSGIVEKLRNAHRLTIHKPLSAPPPVLPSAVR